MTIIEKTNSLLMGPKTLVVLSFCMVRIKATRNQKKNASLVWYHITEFIYLFTMQYLQCCILAPPFLVFCMRILQFNCFLVSSMLQLCNSWDFLAIKWLFSLRQFISSSSHLYVVTSCTSFPNHIVSSCAGTQRQVHGI